jgi:hypothetical protein
VWTGFNWPGQRPEANSCVHGDELSGSIKDGEFEQVNDYYYYYHHRRRRRRRRHHHHHHHIYPSP